MDQQFLIPANSKRSMLIFGVFDKTDLLIFLIGIGTTLTIFLILPNNNLLFTILALAPGLICSFLVLPIPYYHNTRTFIKIFYEFLTTRQKFVWKGWCYLEDEEFKTQDESRKK